MKKIFLFVAVISAFSFASCKKDRTCTCTVSEAMTTTEVGGTGSTSAYTLAFVATKAKKGDAKKACASSKETVAKNYGTGSSAYTETTITTQDCKLK